MTRSKRVVVAAMIVASLAACSGNPFGSDDAKPDQPSAGGTSSEAGAAGSGAAVPGEGGEAGAAPGNGGGAAPEGGAAPGVGGADENVAGANDGPPEPVFTVSKLVDDMEDGNGTLLESNGDWFVILDGSNGTITPPKGEFTMTELNPARGASTMAAAVTVENFTEWGAAFGFDFAYADQIRQAIDLKEALAVRFWTKASKVTTVRFQLPNADTDVLGGKCSGDADNACNAHFTKGFEVDTEWQQTTILFSDLKQDLGGRHVPTFDKHHVYSAFFVIGANQSVTVWIDDIALVH